MFHKPYIKKSIKSEEKPGNSTSTSSSSFVQEDQASEDGLKIKLKKTAKNLGAAATCFTEEDSEAKESEPRIFHHKKTAPVVLKRCLYRPCQSPTPEKREQSRLNNIEGNLLKDVSDLSRLTTKLENPEICANFSPPLSSKVPGALQNAEREISGNKGPGCDANSLAHIDSALDNVSQILDRSWPLLEDAADFPSFKSPNESCFKTTTLLDFCPHCGDDLTNSASSLTINLITNDATFVCRSCDLLIVMENCYRGIGCNSSFRVDVK